MTDGSASVPPEGEVPETPALGDEAGNAAHRGKPWDLREGEGAAAHAAAVCYFEMRGDRSLTKVAQKCSKNRSLIARWSEKWRWVERAAAYDQRMARVDQRGRERASARRAEVWEERRSALRDRDWEAAQRLYRLAERYLEVEEKYLREQPKLGDVATLLRRASELARHATGPSPSSTPPRNPRGRDPQGGSA